VTKSHLIISIFTEQIVLLQMQVKEFIWRSSRVANSNQCDWI